MTLESKESKIKLNVWMQDYGEAHQTKGNRVTHLLGIPLIIASTSGLLNQIEIFETGFFIHGSVGLLVLAAFITFYVSLDLKVGVATAAVFALLYGLGCLLTTPQAWALFALGWILQFLGHILFEKKSPAFFRNVLHLLIGPAYLTNKYLIRR